MAQPGLVAAHPPCPPDRRRRAGVGALLLSRSPRALFRGLYEDRGKILLGIGLIFVVLLVLTGLLSRGIARPIEALGEATRGGGQRDACGARYAGDRRDRDPRIVREFPRDGRGDRPPLALSARFRGVGEPRVQDAAGWDLGRDRIVRGSRRGDDRRDAWPMRIAATAC
jgi:hypothetical protein